MPRLQVIHGSKLGVSLDWKDAKFIADNTSRSWNDQRLWLPLDDFDELPKPQRKLVLRVLGCKRKRWFRKGA